MIVLGIETSCDETGAAIVSDGKLLSQALYTQDEHSIYGGVVPEIASREHIKKLLPVVRETLKRAGLTLADIGGIGAVRGPGLLGSLLVGLIFGKALAWSLRLPFYAVNHIEAHIFSTFIEATPKFPAVAAVISGGHTHIWYISSPGKYKLLGRTRDDAAGEALDKAAKALGLPYPGGPVIDELAKSGNPNYIHFPRPLLDKGFDFSFSGLKTSLIYYLKEISEVEKQQHLNDIAASYQEAIVDVLFKKIVKALETTGAHNLIVAGGVIANSRLRTLLCGLKEYNVFLPPVGYSTDNGVMVALCAEFHLASGENSPLTIPPEPYIELRKNEG